MNKTERNRVLVKEIEILSNTKNYRVRAGDYDPQTSKPIYEIECDVLSWKKHLVTYEQKVLRSSSTNKYTIVYDITNDTEYDPVFVRIYRID